MLEGFQVCMRCRGRKQLYRIGNTNVYSFTDSGGTLVTCPMCQGNGTIKSIKTTEDIAKLINNPDKKIDDKPVNQEVKSDDKGKKAKQAEAKEKRKATK